MTNLYLFSVMPEKFIKIQDQPWYAFKNLLN